MYQDMNWGPVVLSYPVLDPQGFVGLLLYLPLFD